MKTLIVIANILLGLIMTYFPGINSLLRLVYLTTKPVGERYYYGISLTQGLVEATLWIVMGLLLVVSSIALIRNKNWSTITLPIPTITAVLYLAYQVFFSKSDALVWTGGIMVIIAVILTIFLFVEIPYLLKKKEMQKITPLNFRDTTQ